MQPETIDTHINIIDTTGITYVTNAPKNVVACIIAISCVDDISLLLIIKL
jgi:hypothetical protein